MKSALSLVIATLATPAAAQALYFEGDLSFAVSSDDDRSALARIDMIASIGLFRLSSQRLELELGVFGYYFQGDRPHETYAALSLDDRWRVGVMRPAYDLVMPSVFALTAPAVADERAEYARALTTTRALRFNDVPIGLAYTDRGDGYLWGVSIHDADDGDFRSMSAAFELETGQWVWSFASEGVWDRQNTFEGANTKFGARWADRSWTIGMAWLHPDANARPDALAFDLAYALSEELSILTFGELTRHASDRAYGIGGRHAIDGRSDLVLSGTREDNVNEVHFVYTRRY